LVIIIIPLMLSVSIWPKVITLSGFHCNYYDKLVITKALLVYSS
jgi:hypothetical protein